MNKLIVAGTALAFVTTLSAQWTQATPSASPSGRGSHGMDFDPNSGNVLIFGGDTLGFPSGATNQLWRYNGATWSQVTPATPAQPPASVGVQFVYDANRGVFVTYGSLSTSFFGGPSADRTWEYDPVANTWAQNTTLTNTPGGLGLYAMCFDAGPGRNKIVLYGGLPDNFFPIDSNQTWEYDGNNWSLITTSGVTVPPRERAAMCYHAGLQKVLMFGGIDVQCCGDDEVYVYDGPTSTWSIAAVTGPRPPVRTGCRMVYDTVRQICVMTGGSDPTTGNAVVDTWEFDLASLTWTQVPSVTSGRIDAGLAFDPNRRLVVQFGGLDFSTFTALGDTQEYGARTANFGTGCAGSAGVPTLNPTDAPRLGQSYTLVLGNLPLSIGFLVLGLSAITPTPLDAIGMTGCIGYVSPDLLVGLSGTAGSASATLALPPTVSLMGAVLFAQGLSFDPGINGLSLTASNAQQGTLGR